MTTKLFDLTGKVAIVTGGNGGIGLGLARGLADAGADIAVVGRNEAKSTDAVEDLRKRGVKAIAVATDVTDKAAVTAMIERVGKELGRIDILVNNAGTSIRKPTHLLELEEWHRVMDTNLTSAFLCSKAAYPALKAAGRLPGNIVVSTVMSNLGLEKALEADGIRMVRTPVGDKYVLEEMVRLGAALGGEQSGHVIFREYSTTGDGMLTALRLFEIAHAAGVGLDELMADMQVYPQLLVNIRVREKQGLLELPAVAEAIRLAEETFAGSGRVLVRFSGTEPLARVMVEGRNMEQVETLSGNIANAIRRAVDE